MSRIIHTICIVHTSHIDHTLQMTLFTLTPYYYYLYTLATPSRTQRRLNASLQRTVFYTNHRHRNTHTHNAQRTTRRKNFLVYFPILGSSATSIIFCSLLGLMLFVPLHAKNVGSKSEPKHLNRVSDGGNICCAEACNGVCGGDDTDKDLFWNMTGKFVTQKNVRRTRGWRICKKAVQAMFIA